MSSARRKLLRKAPMVSINCGCRGPKLPNFFSPKPKSKSSNYRKPHLHHSSSSSWDGCELSFDDDDADSTTTTFSPSTDLSPPQCPQPKPARRAGASWRIGESVAVVKDSDDPYLDFQHSILQMIIEKEIYSKEDLRELLRCFLSLNSPYHHEIIIRAFMEICNGVFSAPAAPRHKSRDLQGFARAIGT